MSGTTGIRIEFETASASGKPGAYPTGKGQLTEAVRSMIVRCENAGVDIRTGVEADEAVLRSLSPDAIVLETGSNPLILRSGS